MHCRWYPSMSCSRSGGVSRPTPKGEVEGSGLWGVTRPTPRGGCVSQHALTQTPPPDGYCCGRYASYWNAFLLCIKLLVVGGTQFFQEVRCSLPVVADREIARIICHIVRFVRVIRIHEFIV